MPLRYSIYLGLVGGILAIIFNTIFHLHGSICMVTGGGFSAICCMIWLYFYNFNQE